MLRESGQDLSKKKKKGGGRKKIQKWELRARQHGEANGQSPEDRSGQVNRKCSTRREAVRRRQKTEEWYAAV